MPIHLKAAQGDVAPFVLLPGDPGRARYIAETFLEEAKIYTEHRALLGFSGTYKGVPVSVQTTGMGCPSAAIVVEELAQLGARVVIRVGTCGSTSPSVKPTELVVAQGALADDGTTRQYLGSSKGVPLPSFRVLGAAVQAAQAAKVAHHVGLIASEDGFYATKPEEASELHRLYGVLAIEMEASAVFTVARLRGLEAGCLVTVSNFIGDAALVPDDQIRQGVDAMIRVALESVLLLTEA